MHQFDHPPAKLRDVRQTRRHRRVLIIMHIDQSRLWTFILVKYRIHKTIAQLNGDKLLAARLLGIGKTTLYRKLKDYAVQI